MIFILREENMVNRSTYVGDRKVYSKPQLERVRLVPRESVLGVCKTETAGGGINASNCAISGCQDDNGSS